MSYKYFVCSRSFTWLREMRSWSENQRWEPGIYYTYKNSNRLTQADLSTFNGFLHWRKMVSLEKVFWTGIYKFYVHKNKTLPRGFYNFDVPSRKWIHCNRSKAIREHVHCCMKLSSRKPIQWKSSSRRRKPQRSLIQIVFSLTERCTQENERRNWVFCQTVL